MCDFKVTAIIKNVTKSFFEGFGETIRGFDNMSPNEQLLYCCGQSGRDLGITVKSGNGCFRDKITMDDLLKTNDMEISSKIENRRGFILVTFCFKPKNILKNERKD